MKHLRAGMWLNIILASLSLSVLVIGYSFIDKAGPTHGALESLSHLDFCIITKA